MIRQRRSGVTSVKKIALNNNGNSVGASQPHCTKAQQQGTAHHGLKRIPKRIADPRDLQDQTKQNNTTKNVVPVRRASAYRAPSQHLPSNGTAKPPLVRRKSAPAMVSNQQLDELLKERLSEDERLLLANYRLQQRNETLTMNDHKQNHSQTEKNLKKNRRVSFLSQVEEHHLTALEEEQEDE